jgi:hypothetical protein
MNPWNFSRTMIELRLIFRHIGLGISQPDTSERAKEDLSKFTASFMEHSLDPEETDVVGDVLRGLDGTVAEEVW